VARPDYADAFGFRALDGRSMPRFRDSWLIRIGMGIIAFLFITFLVLAGAEKWFAYSPDMWPANLWAMFWIVVGLLLIFIGIGQTIVRRRVRKDI
jgi:uncharacterized membrane protein